MTTDEKLKDLFSRGKQIPAALRWVKVTSVDKDNDTMDVVGLSDNLEYYDVQLGAGSVVIYPVIGTMCLIAVVEGIETDTFLISSEQAESIRIKADTEIVMNEGKLGGLVKVKELTDILNNVIDKFNGHTHQMIGVKTGPDTITIPEPSSKIDNVNRKTIENESVRQ